MNEPMTTPEQFEAARHLIRDAGLPMPPIPKGISEKLFRPQDTNYFTSRTNTPGPWSLGWFLEEVEYGNPQSYVMIGIDGHGQESSATHFYLVEEDIAFFHQSQMISPSNPELEESLSDQYDLMAIIAVATAQAKEKGQMAEESRLVIVRPTYRHPFWGIQPRPGHPIDWKDAEDALLDASNWLAKRMH
ncbi:hypothetical protein [Endozoicomonas numazuensis]|uniref:Uncharacterized protein n=1 Tax=Endozoicomonas numazuensis TaxID=1137799 RepID=A0A081NEI1_9GAMM|nr:hypothetical protein [Endozoicomonas numazuensis]KEQ16854.1 hypothetical protein GZ78_19520 [Endozoicomonas numazuensis]